MSDRSRSYPVRAAWSSRITAGALTALLASGWADTAAAQSPYEGTTIRFLTARNVHQTAVGDKLAEIAKEWGIDFDVRYVTTDELEKKVVLDYVGGAETWDLVYTGGVQRMYEWANGGIINEMTPLIEQHGDPEVLNWDAFTEAARNAVTTKEEKVLGLPVATSDQALAYRTDLFSHPEEKAAFQERYGYELAPPETYEQFYDVAEFFTREAGETLAGETLENDFYGTSFSNKRGTFLWHDYENIVLAFGVDIYDPETGEVGLTSQPSIEAARYYQSLVPFLPPGHINMSSGESTTLFASDRVAMVVEYFDRVVSTVDKEDTPIEPEQVDYTFPPTLEGNPRGLVHPFRSGPAVVSIFGRSRNPEAAYKLLEAVMTTENQLDMARKHFGYMPTKVPALEALVAEQPVVDYLVRISEEGVDALTDAEIMPYPSILKASEIGDAVSNAMSQILLGAEVEPELEKAQAELEAAFADLPQPQ
ncbi:MAG: extracellular solute-binding protein [Pseudomonadota bacterium]|nr:extracellular solute-binding protein [Pseudomonadota bacterium]